MEFTIRKEIIPNYFQVGYPTLFDGVFVGESASLPEQPITALHYHHCLEFGICCSGSGETHIKNRIYRFSPGTIQYVGNNIPHLSTSDPGVESSWIWIFVDAANLLMDDGSREIAELWAATDEAYNGVFRPEEHPRLSALIDHLRQRGNKEQPFRPLENTFLVGELLIEAARIGDIDNTVRINMSSKLKAALLYIRDHYTDPAAMSEAQVAASCGLSISHFRALFKSDIGTTLPQYVNKTRLSSALYLLQTTEKSITAIAAESGFEGVSYFNRVFRQEFGVSPREMRKRQKSSILSPI